MTWLRSSRFRRASWLVMASLVLVSLVRATLDEGPPRSAQEQVRAIANTLKCPVCRSQSVAHSDVAAARAIRLRIAELLEEGRTASQIRAEIAATYSEEVQLIPPASGFAGLVWILPVAALVVASAALSAAFARWRRMPERSATDEDRALVERALGRR